MNLVLVWCNCGANSIWQRKRAKAEPIVLYGAGGQIRTGYLPITNRLLYQLSYAGVGAIVPVTGHGDKNQPRLVIRWPLLPLRITLPDGG